MKNSPSVRECTPEEYAVSLVQLEKPNSTISFLQAPFYGAWQARDGKTVVYFVAESDDTIIAAGLAVLYTAPGGISFLYCPYGPTVLEWTPELLVSMKRFFTIIAKRSGATFVRLDDATLTQSHLAKPVPNKLAITASLQPRAEWLLDITDAEDTIWMQLHKHARYNVRLAERANATLSFYSPNETPMDIFFSLMQTTAGRDSFSIQSRAYYEAVLQSIPRGQGFVAICSIDGTPAATALFAEYGGTVHYVFAGSSDDFRKIAPPYFVLWNSIIEAKRRGWTTLNFGGISDTVKGTHLTGVTSFKKRFGGYSVTHPNPVDIVYKPVRYALFSLYKYLHP
jgi:lipid II:glycine glycyltransferase (peptidoglycan interpeptide bridge formation enzyme)